jgi:hypothetical protein
VLVTNGTGVPSVSTTLPTGLAMQTPASITLTNATGLPLTGLATQAANTVLANATGSPASPTAVTTLPTGLTVPSATLSSPTITTAFNATGLVTVGDLATQATNTVLGNATSGTASPTALAVGSCSAAADALIWTTNTGFGCNTSITAAAAPVAGITGFGAGVETALTVNVGTAGAFVVLGGAGGTPSSLTLTNATGLPISGIASLGTGVGTALGNNVNVTSGLVTQTATLTANLPVIGGGSGTGVSVGTRSGNTTAFVTTTGAHTTSDCAQWDLNGNLIDSGAICGGGGGGSLTVTDGTNSVTSTTTLTVGNGFVVGGSAGSATLNLKTGDNTKTANYSVAAADMGQALNLDATTGTPALTLPAASSTIFAPGMSLNVTNNGTVNWTITNSTGLTMTGLNSTTLPPGAGGTFVANANGTGIDFFPGQQLPTSTSLGGVTTTALAAHNFATGVSSTTGALTGAQPACADISNAGTSCTVNTGTSGATIPLNNGNLTLSGTDNFTGTFELGGNAFATGGALTFANMATANDLLYVSSAGNVGQLASGNNGVLITGPAGAPSISSTLPSGMSAPSLTVTTAFTATGLVTNADLANSSMTLAGHSVSLGGTQAIACGDLSNGATGCSTAIGTSGATIPLLNTANAWSAPQRTNTETPAISTSTFTPVFSTGQNHRIVLVHASCPCTIANPAAIVAGQSGMIEIAQSATGSDTIGTWGSEYEYAGGTSSITLSTGANAVDYLPYYVDSTGSFIVLGGIVKGPAH